MAEDNLDDFLNGSEAVEAPEPVEVDTPAPTEPTQPRDEQGRFAPKGETAPPATEPTTEPTAPPAVENTPQNIPPKALQEERRKRQELERRLADYEARFAQFEQPAQPQFQPQTTQPAIPDRWEDPEGYDQYLIAQAEQRAAAAAEQRFIQRHLDISEQAARERHADFDEKLAVFQDLVAANPTLARKMTAHPDPAGFAYTTAAKAMEVEQYGTIDQLVAAKVAEALAAAQPAPAPAPVPTVPTTLADAQSAKASAAAPAGPPSLADILKR